MFIDGENGENFLTMFVFSKYGIGTSPKIQEEKQPTIDKYVMQKLIELEQEVKELKEKLNKIEL